jgi:predicted aconitase with swiveling domain
MLGSGIERVLGGLIMGRLARGRSICEGIAEGEALVTNEPISFFGGIDPNSGLVTERGCQLYGLSISGKILVFPGLKGSTSGTWIIYRLSERGVAPKAMVVTEADIILIAGAILGNIPAVDNFSFDPTVRFKNGERLRVNGFEGTVEVLTENAEPRHGG